MSKHSSTSLELATTWKDVESKQKNALQSSLCFHFHYLPMAALLQYHFDYSIQAAVSQLFKGDTDEENWVCAWNRRYLHGGRNQRTITSKEVRFKGSKERRPVVSCSISCIRSSSNLEYSVIKPSVFSSSKIYFLK